MPLPPDPADAEGVTGVIERARKVLEYLEPLNH